eukprot:TRINITY_DN115034_c0_g1_i1.p1 TRINITY_DN115034_c0_g1~~TRINITY_DN115034_c0_g1_i1.p1  ORF type:complete len:306 (+),score=35.88 TRINITY_DN115034_c0_g1_i1:61-978(+)
MVTNDDVPQSLTADALSTRTNTYSVQALNQQDLDRNFALATWQVLKWMQAARMELPWMQPGYRALGLLEPKMPRRMLVGSQMIRLAEPGALSQAVNHTVSTCCELGAVGRTSVEFRYKIFFGQRLVATATTTMIVASGTPGSLKPSPVPDSVRALAAPDEGADRKLLVDALAALPKEAPADAYSHPILVRYSDEDVNKHANHSALARYFEDAKEAVLEDECAQARLRSLAERPLEAIQIAYLAEIRASDELSVQVAAEGHAARLQLWVYRKNANKFGGKPGLVARGCILCCEAPSGSSGQRPSKL